MKPTLALTLWFVCEICGDDCSKYDSKRVFFSNRSGSIVMCDDCLVDLLGDGSLKCLGDGWFEIIRPVGIIRANLF